MSRRFTSSPRQLRRFAGRFSAAPLAVLLLVILNLLLFSNWAGSFLGTPPATIAVDYGLRIPQPVTYFTYTFVHLWPLHLFANLAFLLAFGVLVEPVLGHRDFLFFYLIGSALAGLSAMLIDSAFGATGAVVGASGAIFLLFGAAMAVRPLKATAAYLLLSLFVVPLILSIPLHLAQSAVKETAVREVEQIEAEKETLEQSYASEEISEEAYSEQVGVLSEAMGAPAKQITTIQQAQQHEATVPAAETVHYTGLTLGMLSMLALRPKLVDEWRCRFDAIIAGLQSLRKR